MENRTDLALESYESANKTVIDGVIVEEGRNITTVRVTNENGEKELQKPMGTYITYTVPNFISDTDIFDGRLDDVSSALKALLPNKITSVLVAGVGNLDITADALGPKVNDYVLATRHMKQSGDSNGIFDDFFNVSSFPTGVLGDTGIESAELVKGVVTAIQPSCVIVVDALAATSKERLGRTVQLSDTGIAPGSGVGNHRYEISKKTMGVPVISIGIPTVLSTAFLGDDSDGSMFVTPREIDRIIEQGAKLIGMSINVCLHQNISARDLLSLVG